ncbi:hypothetical protein [Streptomyces sp. NRRL S-87]|uniref:hypothetical protein n=1 Tax=Streptomyces sp. NRRL S-87 TaxID=1463920 RepID=UPI00131B6C83|nr:hypothetical protein [Streptomyces sp. NRRL S-87]
MDAFLPSPQETLTLQRGEAVLTNSCLGRLGFNQNPMPLPSSMRPTERHPEFIDVPLRQAQRIGYSRSDAPAENTRSAWDEKSSKVQQDLLFGRVKSYGGRVVPAGGCIREVAEKITSGTRIPRKIVGGGVELNRMADASPTGLAEAHIDVVRLDAIAQAKRDGRVRDSASRWAACMARHGMRYRSPDESANDPRWSGDSVSSLERETAVADMKCQAEVRYRQTMIAVQSVYEERVIKARASELGTLRSNLKRWVANSAEAVRAAS